MGRHLLSKLEAEVLERLCGAPVLVCSLAVSAAFMAGAALLAWTLLRRIEHALQYQEDEQTQHVPVVPFPDAALPPDAEPKKDEPKKK